MTSQASGEIRNARAVICLADGDPAGALAAVAGVVDGSAPVLGYVTVVEAHLLAGLAHGELGDQRAASQAAERALALAEADRLILPFAMTGSAGLLEALPRHQTAHAALLADILDVLHGSSPAAKSSPGRRRRRSSARASCGCCGTCRPTVPARDRRPAVGLAEHRQRAYPQHLRQARCPGPILGRAARPGTAAAGRWPDALAIPGTRRNASVRQRPRLLLNSLRLALSARRLRRAEVGHGWSPRALSSPFTQVEMRRLRTYSDGALTVKGHRVPRRYRQGRKLVLVDQATGNVRGVVPPEEFSRRFRPVDLFPMYPVCPPIWARLPRLTVPPWCIWCLIATPSYWLTGPGGRQGPMRS